MLPPFLPVHGAFLLITRAPRLFLDDRFSAAFFAGECTSSASGRCRHRERRRGAEGGRSCTLCLHFRGAPTARLRPDRPSKILLVQVWTLSGPVYTFPYSVVCPLAPSRGGVLQLRGNPVHGTNPRRPVFTLRPLPYERAPPGARALLPPQPDADHPARWVRFSAPRPWM